MLLLDAFLLHRAAMFLEKEVIALDAVLDDEEQGDALQNVHAKVSRKVDRYLGRGLRPRVSIFVSLLTLATVACFTTGLGWFALWGYLNTSKSMKHCMEGEINTSSRNEEPSSRNEEPIENIPDDLQDWAKTVVGNFGVYSDTTSPSSPYIHMVDGTTYFIGRQPSNGSWVNQDRATLASTGPDGSIRFYPNVQEPKGIWNVKGENALASQSFCCVYDENLQLFDRLEQEETRGNYTKKTMLFCLTASEESGGTFRNTTLYEKTIYHPSIASVAAKLYEDKLWLGLELEPSYFYFSPESDVPVNRNSREFYKVEPEAMKIVSVANISDTQYSSIPFSLYKENNCSNFFNDAIILAVVVSVLIPVSFWLVKVHQMPVGVVPACVAAFHALGWMSDGLALGLGFVAAVSVTLALLVGLTLSWMGREVLVWALYTIWPSLAVLGVDRGGEIVAPVLMLCVGVMLNHPVFEIVGFVGGVSAVCFGVISLLFHLSEPKVGFLIIFLGIIFGCGTVTIGYNLTKYRAYILYYLKRWWRGVIISYNNIQD
jgi:hypothetical protein